MAGNVLNIQSWDGTALGTQWRVTCPTLSAHRELDRVLDAEGTGYISYLLLYSWTGELWLSKDGPWKTDGSQDFVETLLTIYETRYYQYILGTRAAVVSEFDLSAGIDPVDPMGPQPIHFTIHRMPVVWGWGHGYGLLPLPDYPTALGSDCQADSDVAGVQADAENVFLSISYPVPVAKKTWGQIKALYR